MAEGDKKYDVVAVSQKTSKVRLIGENKTKENAEAIETMAVIRRGVDEEFFATVPAGMYKEGDKYRGTGE